MCADAACGNINFAWRTSCNRCSKEKVGGSSSGSSGSKKKLGHEIGESVFLQMVVQMLKKKKKKSFHFTYDLSHKMN